jgi:PAS domain S-box-containing protein
MKIPLRVLIVEDNDDDRLLLLRTLKQGGYEPMYRCVQTATALSGALAEEAWDIVLCDYLLPQFNGSEALACVQKTGLDLPFIMVSGVIGEEQAVTIMKAGAHDYVLKDKLARLVPAITRELRDAEVRRQRRQAESQLRASEAQFRLLFEANPNPMWVFDEETLQFLAVNDAALRHYGYTRDEFLALTVLDIRMPEDRPQVVSLIASQKGAKGTYVGEFRHQKKSGTLIDVEITVSSIPFNGRPGRLVLSNDITEQKLIEAVKARYELIARYARDPLLLVDLEGNIIEVNQAAVELFGYTRDELLKLRLHALQQDDPEVVDLRMEQARKSGVLFECVHVCKDGTPVAVEISSRGVFILGQEMLLSVIRDIRQRKETELTLRRAKEEAENANRAKSDFLAAMSHELRTPLNAIMGFSQVLAQEYFGPLTDKQKEYATDIYQSGKHLLSLINDILDLSKIEAGKMEPKWSCFNIDALLEQSRTLVREKCFKHNIALDFKRTPSVKDLMITADERRVKQILYNLLSNATKFTPDCGSIRVQAQLTDELVPMLEITVADTGIGISAEHLPHIFEPFYQVHDGTVNKTPGTGLGLCLVRQLATMHGGSVRVESEGERRGSRFTVILPVDARSAMAARTPEKGET